MTINAGNRFSCPLIDSDHNGLPFSSHVSPWEVRSAVALSQSRSLSGIGSLEARINNLRAIPGL